MEMTQLLEWIGYLGSIIVALSLMMTSMVNLRWTNLLGALVFTVYGICIKAIPVALVNAFIVLIDSYYLYKLYATHDYYTLVETEKDNPYIFHFLNYYKTDIKKAFPRFDFDQSSADCCVMILRNMDMAGLFIGHKEEEGGLVIDIDYAAPRYRDYKTGKYLYVDHHHFLSSKGLTHIVLPQANKHQEAYYKHMGFCAQPDGSYVKKL